MSTNEGTGRVLRAETTKLQHHAGRPPGQRAEPARRGPADLLLLAVLATGACTGSGPPSAAAAPKPGAVGANAGGAGGGNVQLRKEAAATHELATSPVRTTRLSPDVDVIGSVAPSQDHLALVGPLVGGRVAKLNASVGATVKKGQVLGEIESAEVGAAQADFLSAGARAKSAEANLARESELAAKRISSEREREQAVAQAASENAHYAAASERLRAMGFSSTDIAALGRGAAVAGRVPMRAPISGTVLERNVTLGQAVERATDAFKIADLDTLWVLLDLYEKDLTKVHVGGRVQLRSDVHGNETFEGRVAYVQPVIDEETRTATVRIELDNRQRKFSLGQLVTAHIVGDPTRATRDVLAIPRSAIQRVDGKTVVFVRSKDRAGEFQRRRVEVGQPGGELVEVKQGLSLGEEVVTDGAFLLKSELLR